MGALGKPFRLVPPCQSICPGDSTLQCGGLSSPLCIFVTRPNHRGCDLAHTVRHSLDVWSTSPIQVTRRREDPTASGLVGLWLGLAGSPGIFGSVLRDLWVPVWAFRNMGRRPTAVAWGCG